MNILINKREINTPIKPGDALRKSGCNCSIHRIYIINTEYIECNNCQTKVYYNIKI